MIQEVSTKKKKNTPRKFTAKMVGRERCSLGFKGHMEKVGGELKARK